MVLELPKAYADAIIAHALEEDPDECCGVIAGKNGRAVKHYRITNAEKSPYRYSMDSKEFFKAYREIEDSGWDILALYHSHTHSPAYPSATDVRLATWPDAYYVLVTLMDKTSPQIRAFLINPGNNPPADSMITEVPVAIN